MCGVDEDGRRFEQSQYDFLKRCSERGEEGMAEWNSWRDAEHAEILLEGAHLRRRTIRGFNFFRAYLRSACLYEADAERANFRLADLRGVDLFGANLRQCKLAHADLTDARMANSVLESAEVWAATLRGATLPSVRAKDTNFSNAGAEGAGFDESDLRGACFEGVITDGRSSFRHCRIDRRTDFSGVPLGGLRIDPATKQLLEYNIRRENWEEWYRSRPVLKWLAKPFWWVSDYGLSTGRVLGAFLVLALAFALVYYLAAIARPPGVVNSLLEGTEGPVPCWLVPVLAIYFSVVTMTTLGFGDMHANCQSLLGHLLLSTQVLLGYVLLGALVTRFAVLFTAGGPAGRFADSSAEDQAADEEVS